MTFCGGLHCISKRTLTQHLLKKYKKTKYIYLIYLGQLENEQNNWKVKGQHNLKSPPPITRTVTQVLPVKNVSEHLPLLFKEWYETERDFLFLLFLSVKTLKMENVVQSRYKHLFK